MNLVFTLMDFGLAIAGLAFVLVLFGLGIGSKVFGLGLVFGFEKIVFWTWSSSCTLHKHYLLKLPFILVWASSTFCPICLYYFWVLLGKPKFWQKEKMKKGERLN